MEKSPRMLEGYRVLDFTHFVAGPTCTRILGEMGADVIKVERNQQGDHVRLLGMVKDGMSSYYFQHNHSKRSLALDFQKPEAKELVLKLIPKIDVVVENFAPGVIAAMTPGAKFSTTTSIFGISLSSSSFASGFWKSSARLRLE